ncbi:MAG TPA: alpha/beta hydrolase [Ktedonobacterales bacterium]
MQHDLGNNPQVGAVTKRTAVIKGLRIAYEDVGHGSPAVVLIHGAFGNRTHYAKQMEHLAPQHRVLAIDLRGHGESDVPQEGYRLRDYAEDVVAVCEAAGLDRYLLCGHSMPVALIAASLTPDRVAGVALLDGTILFPESLRSQVLANVVPVLEGDGWVEAMQGYLVGRGIGPYDSAELKARVLTEIAQAPAQIAAPMMRDVMTLDFSHFLTGSYPLLYMHARVPADLTRLRELHPDVLLGSVVGSGHWMMLAVPDQVNAMLDRFLYIVGSRAPGGD